MTSRRPLTQSLRLGYGCAGAWGKKWFSERAALRLVHQAIAEGVAHFDTGAFYDGGEAEKRLGRALSSAPGEDVFVSTKTGTRRDGWGRIAKDFSDAGIRADVETSLSRLRRERLDLLYLHGPSIPEIEMARDTLAALKAEGKIDRAGVCGEGAPLAHAATAEEIDVIMGVYNLLRREHAGVFKSAKAAGRSVVAIAPLAQGLYRRDFFAPRSLEDAWHLARALAKNRTELKNARKARAALEEIDGWTPGQAALGFVLANENIDVAVMATTKPENLTANIDAARRWMPPVDVDRLSNLRLAQD